MEVSYTLTARDLVWSTLRQFLRSNPVIGQRAAGALACVLLVPLLIAGVFGAKATAVVFWLLVLDIAAAVIVVAAIAALGQRFLGPMLDASVDGVNHSLSIGPDCLAESGDSDIVTPWVYVSAVLQDPWSITIVVGAGQSFVIPRRAFPNYFTSWVFGLRAHGYWRRARPSVLN